MLSVVQTAFNLCAGTYTVTVTDADCSVDSATIEIICLLPVTLETFYGENRDLTNTLFWTTASENNSALFIVEKMGEEGKFVPIGEITAAGNSTELSNLYSVQIFDLSANLLINAELSSTNTNKLNLSNLNSGTYLMRVFSDKNLIYSSVIIKNL